MRTAAVATRRAKVLRENALGEDARALDQAWSESTTFALIPDRSPVDEAWVAAALDRLPEHFRRDHFALLTSGTTGRARLVVGCRRRAETLVDLLHQAQQSEPVRESVVVLPLSYCYAFVNQWLWARRRGRRLILGRHFGAPAALRAALDQADAAMICLVSAQVSLLEEHFGDARFDGVLRVHFAGARFPAERIDRIRSFFPEAEIYNNYGCTEAMPRLALRRVEQGFAADDIGLPLPGVELRSFEEQPIAPLFFRSAYGAVALVDDDEVHVIQDDEWIDTGDIARRNADGSWSIHGRSNEVFKRYGEKVSMSRVLATMQEAVAGRLAGYGEVDARQEAGFVAVSCPAPSEEELRAMLAKLRASHPRSHWPLRIEAADSMPKLPSGKIDLYSLSRRTRKVVIWRQRI